LENIGKEAVMVCFQVISDSVSGRTVEGEKYQTVQIAFYQKTEPGTSRIRSENGNNIVSSSS
jgi:hypothetical protein